MARKIAVTVVAAALGQLKTNLHPAFVHLEIDDDEEKPASRVLPN